jgi:hypothetical protein
MFASPSTVQQYQAHVDSIAVTYGVPQPAAFLTSPNARPTFGDKNIAELFGAYYEKTLLTGAARYDLAGTLNRTDVHSLPASGFTKDALLAVLRRNSAFAVLTNFPGRQVIEQQTVSGNDWLVFRNYDVEENLLKSVIFVKPLGTRHILLFRLTFWSGSKGAAWRRARLPLLDTVVRSVRIQNSAAR